MSQMYSGKSNLGGEGGECHPNDWQLIFLFRRLGFELLGDPVSEHQWNSQSDASRRLYRLVNFFRCLYNKIVSRTFNTSSTSSTIHTKVNPTQMLSSPPIWLNNEVSETTAFSSILSKSKLGREITMDRKFRSTICNCISFSIASSKWPDFVSWEISLYGASRMCNSSNRSRWLILSVSDKLVAVSVTVRFFSFRNCNIK